MVVRHARVAVACNGVVAAIAFEFIEGGPVAIDACTPGIRARGCKSGGVVGVRKIGSPDCFNRKQRVRARVGPSRHNARRQIDDDAGVVGCLGIHCTIEAATAVDEVVAAQALEILGRAGRIIAAGERVVKERAANVADAGKGIGTDGGVAGRDARCPAARGRPTGDRIEGNGDAGSGVEIRNPGLTVADDGVVATTAFELVEQPGGVRRDGAAGVGAGGTEPVASNMSL
jgi:hypothetical protein